MRRPLAIFGILIILIAFLFYSSGIGIELKVNQKVEEKVAQTVEAKADQNENDLKSGFIDLGDLELTKVDENIWVHTSYIDYKGVRTPSNGLIVITSEGLLLIDTPWNEVQTKKLITVAEEKMGQPFVKAIITHAHSDRIGGISELINAEIETYSTSMTAEFAVENGYQRPNIMIESNDVINLDRFNFEIFYPGEGHSKDNIVVWLPEKKILFAGCLVKSLEAEDIGNVADANVQEWTTSLEKLNEKYKDVSIVIPGHGRWGDQKLIEHTLKLIKEN